MRLGFCSTHHCLPLRRAGHDDAAAEGRLERGADAEALQGVVGRPGGLGVGGGGGRGPARHGQAVAQQPLAHVAQEAGHDAEGRAVLGAHRHGRPCGGQSQGGGRLPQAGPQTQRT